MLMLALLLTKRVMQPHHLTGRCVLLSADPAYLFVVQFSDLPQLETKVYWFSGVSHVTATACTETILIRGSVSSSSTVWKIVSSSR